MSKMQDIVLRTPSINGEMELLLSLAEKEATVHVALAAHYWAHGQPGAAEGEWDRACVRLDALSEFMDEMSRRGQGASPFDKQGAAKVAKNYFKPPGVNKRGCKQFRDRSWVSEQRAWPPSNLSLPVSLSGSLSLSLSPSFARALSLSDTQRAAAAHGAQVNSAGRVCGAVVGACACLCVSCAMQWPPHCVVCARKCAEQVLTRLLCEQICSTTWMPSLLRRGRFRRIVVKTQLLVA